MRYVNSPLDSPLARLMALIALVDNPLAQRRLEDWVSDYIKESGTELNISRESLLHAHGKQDSLITHYERRVYEAIGEQLFKDCGVKETRETPYGIAIRYNFYAITKGKK